MKTNPLTLGLLLWVCAAAGFGCHRGKNTDKFLANANRYYDARDLEKAKIEYFNALKIQPTNATAILRLGKIFYRQGQFREAFQFLNESRRRTPDDVEAGQQLASIYLAAGEPGNARTNALWVLARTPTNEAALSVLFDASQSPKETNALVQTLDQLQKSAGDRPAFHVLRGLLALRMGDVKGGDTEVSRALALDPKSTMAHSAMGRLRWSFGVTNGAEKEFRTAASLAPPEDEAHFRLANFLLRTGRIEEAKKTLDDINRDAPERTGAWTLAAEVAMAERRLDDAEKLLARALGQAPGDVEARSLQAKLKLAQNKPAEAVRILKDLVDKYPQAAELEYQLGLAFVVSRDVNSAAGAFTRASTLTTNNINAVLMLAELNFARGQAAAAVTGLEEVTRRAPDIQRASFLLGGAYFAVGRTNDAVQLFRTLQTRYPTNPAAPFQLGLMLRRAGRDPEALKAFQDTRKLAPEDLGPVDQIIAIHLAAKAPAKALAELQPLLDRQPKSAQVWLLRAQIYEAERNDDGAEGAIQKAIELEPDLQSSYLMLAQLYARTGKQTEAVQKLDALLKKNAENVSALTLRGMLLSDLDRPDDAQKAYEAALKVNPNGVLVLNNLAYLTGIRGSRIEEAYGYATKARQLAPENASIADTLGAIEYKRGNFPEALRLLVEAEAKAVGSAEVEAHLGLAHYMMGHEEPAKKALTLALKGADKFPDRDLAQKRLALLNALPSLAGDKLVDALDTRLRDDPQDVVAALHLGIAYEAAGSADKARAAYDGAYKQNPALAEAVLRLAILEVDHDRTRAADLGRQAQKLVPDDPRVSQILGRLALRSGDTAVAYGMLQKAATQSANQPGIWFDFADAAFGSGRVDEAANAMKTALKLGLPAAQATAAQTFVALTAFAQNPAGAAQNQPKIEEILKADPANGPALYANALALEQKGSYSEARDNQEKLLARYPSFSPAVRQLALLYGERLTNDAKASEYASKARGVYPNDEVLAKTMARLAARRGDDRYAVQLFSEVLRSHPEDADTLFQTGLAYLRLKQATEGRAALERAIRLNPNAAFVPEARKALSGK